MPGYHNAVIPKGVYGEPSKITEEHGEFVDAINQDNPLMALQELSDMVGAIEAYLKQHHPSISMRDLITMADATKRAFKSGARK